MIGMQPMKVVYKGIEYRVWHHDIAVYLGSMFDPSAIEAVHGKVMQAAVSTAIDVVEVMSSGHVWVRWRDGTEPSDMGHWHVTTSKDWGPEDDDPNRMFPPHIRRWPRKAKRRLALAMLRAVVTRLVCPEC